MNSTAEMSGRRRVLQTLTRTVGHDGGWSLAAVTLAAFLAFPIIAVIALGFTAPPGMWAHLISTVLPASTLNTLALLAGAGTLAAVIGTVSAWLVTMYRFPGREIADRLLVLPLAMPVYIVAYAYADLLDYAGPVQTTIRSAFGFKSPADYVFPQVRSLYGAIGIFAAAFYPYVYLSARASFVQQSVCALEVARTLGRTAGGTFWSVALPMARPALAAGIALVLMECLNDLGAVQYLGVETLSASVYATWLQRGNLAGAAQLSTVMLFLIVALLMGERLARGDGGVQNTTGRYRPIPFELLSGWRAAAAFLLVILPFVAGFLVPFALLVKTALAHLSDGATADYFKATRNSLMLAALASATAVLLALFFGYALRIGRSAATAFAARSASLGYALPGTVLAVGILGPLAATDNAIDGFMRDTFGMSTGLMLSGSIFAVTLALVIRFLAVALGTIEAGLERISVNLDAAARTLGAGSWTTLLRIHLPMIVPAAGAAALLVFVDAMKELPATLLLRPFNFETLATHVYGLTAAEQFEAATVGAVTIVLVGLLPVLFLHHTIAKGRTGGSGSS